jgi:hypothetical protein
MLSAVNLQRAQFLAIRAHRGQLLPTGEPLIAHVRRVAATTPEFARPVAWLHEVLEWTSTSEEDLNDRLRHNGPGVNGRRLTYERALHLILAAGSAIDGLVIG